MQTSKLFNTFSVNTSYVITLPSVFVQANGQLDTLPPFFYYELLVPCVSGNSLFPFTKSAADAGTDFNRRSSPESFVGLKTLKCF